jgi:ubiquinone/menaquinone biosynthesis C-methylase UbiE
MSATEISVAEGYDAWASTYDEVANRIRDEAMAKVRQWTSHFAGKTVLEIGCGTGLNTEHLAAHAARVTAIDFSEGMLAIAARRVVSPKVELRRHDLMTGLPGGPETYDTVLETLVLEHIEDLAPVFREAFRVLRPGGVLLTSELHPYQQAQGKQARFAAPGGEVLIEAYGHTISDFANAAIGAGLRLVRLEEDADPAGEPRLFSLVAEKPPL